MEKLLTSAELAGMLRVSAVTIRRLAREGTLPAVRFGATLRFQEDAVRKAIGLSDGEAPSMPTAARRS